MVDKSEKFRWLVQLGFAARGLVYLLIGYLALTASRGDKGPEGAMSWLQDVPLGVPLLYLAALGLLAYALYRLASLLFDVDNHGTHGKGVVTRIGHGASGIAHLLLAWTAFQFAQGDKQSASGGGAQEAAGSLLTYSFGSLLLGLIGLGFFAAAALQAKSAWTGSFMKRVAGNAPSFAKPLGHAGHAARAVVFAIIGWSLVQSAWLSDTAEVKTLGEAVSSLADKGTIYTLVAIGLLLFGLFSLAIARYRIVPDIDGADLRPSLH
jgi:hypothetical protein